jgi:hypothetical protein
MKGHGSGWCGRWPGHATTVVVECGLATALGTRAAIGVADQFVLVTDRSLCVSVCLC